MRRGWMAAIVLAAAACSDDAGKAEGPPEVDLERVEVDASPAPPVAPIGDVLLAKALADTPVGGAPVDALVRSRDGGATWEPVDLPEAPANITFDAGRPAVVGGIAVVTGRTMPDLFDPSGSPAYLWTSADGETWHGKKVAANGPTSSTVSVDAAGDVLIAGAVVSPNPPVEGAEELVLWRSTDGGETWIESEIREPLPGPNDSLLDVLEDGDRLTAIPQGERRDVLESTDDGASWSLADCPVPPTGLEACDPIPEDGVPTGWNGEVTVDGGETWQPLELGDRRLPAGRSHRRRL